MSNTRRPLNSPQINRNSWQARGLIGWWPMRPAFDMVDHSGNGHRITNQGPDLVTDSDFGWVMDFERSNDDYFLFDSPILTAAPMTLCAWVKLEGTLEQTVFSITNADVTNDFFNLQLQDSSGYKVAANIRRSATVSCFSTTTLGTGTWHHVCGVYHSPTLRNAFLDGGGKGTSTVDTTPIAGNLNTINIGRLHIVTPRNRFDGLMADVRAYNRALSDREVYQLFAPETRWDLYRPRRRPNWKAEDVVSTFDTPVLGASMVGILGG